MIYFVSDFHIGHARIIEYGQRPFASVEEMNEVLVNNWNSIVKSEDTVYFLGDFSLSAHYLTYVSRLNGCIILIAGNHDKCFDYVNKKAGSLPQRRKLYYDAGFKEIINGQTTIQIDDKEVILCHFPYFEDHPGSEPRYKEHRPIDKGQWLIHGHIHQHRMKRGRQINVSCEVTNYRPISLEQIVQVMNDPRDFILNVGEL